MCVGVFGTRHEHGANAHVYGTASRYVDVEMCARCRRSMCVQYNCAALFSVVRLGGLTALRCEWRVASGECQTDGSFVHVLELHCSQTGLICCPW